MFTDTITYENYDGVTVTDTLYFNLTKPELMKLQYSIPGGYESKLTYLMERIEAYQKNNENKNNPDFDIVIGETIDFFEEMVLSSYGIKSEDGKRFIKSEEIRKEFSDSIAYSTFFMKLVNDPDFTEKFFIGIIPSDIRIETSK